MRQPYEARPETGVSSFARRFVISFIAAQSRFWIASFRADIRATRRESFGSVGFVMSDLYQSAWVPVKW